MTQSQENRTQAVLDLLTKGWAGFLAGPGQAELLAELPAWLRQQRWFGAKSRQIAAIRVAAWCEFGPDARSVMPTAAAPSASTLGDALLLIALRYTDGTEDRYQVPLAFATGAEADGIRDRAPASIVLALDAPTGPAVLLDATQRAEFRDAMLHLIVGNRSLAMHTVADAVHKVAESIVAAHEGRPIHELAPGDPDIGVVEQSIESRHRIEPAQAAPAFLGHMPGVQTEGATQTIPVPGGSLDQQQPSAAAVIRGASTAGLTDQADGTLLSRVGSAEQSNTNFLFGDRLLMKLFRRLQPGENPDVEIGRFLTEQARFQPIAPLLGEISTRGQEIVTLAMLQPMIANQGDGWEWTLEQLAGLLSHLAASPGLSTTAGADAYPQAAEHLGQRTAEMHLALATPTADPAFAPEPLTGDDLKRDAKRVAEQMKHTLDVLEARLRSLPEILQDGAATLLSSRSRLADRAQGLASSSGGGERIRIHGDFHLGQILRTAGDFVLLDFEGEPARSLAERRRKQCPLRDVAGMLRSFSYAAATGLNAALKLYPEHTASLPAWCEGWRESAVRGFLAGYRRTVAQRPSLLPAAHEADALLDLYLLEKALYELLYELNNRPDWVGIPLGGILSLLH